MSPDTRSAERSEIKDRKSRGGAPADAGDPFADVYVFKELILWQKARDLANDVLQLVDRLPKDRTTNVLTQQIVRSSTSIAANVAEGHGRFTLATYRNHLSVARGSTTETVSWLDLFRRRGLVSAAEERALLATLSELMRMISAKMIQLSERMAERGNGSPRVLRDARTAYETDDDEEEASFLADV